MFPSFLFEQEFCNLLRDIDGDGFHSLVVDVETKEKNLTSADHRCKDCAIKGKLGNI